jgi:hypothetical protein
MVHNHPQCQEETQSCQSRKVFFGRRTARTHGPLMHRSYFRRQWLD